MVLEGGIVREDRPFELPKRATRLEAELLGEAVPAAPRLLERAGVLSRAIQRQHELPEEPFAERVLADEALDLTDEFCGQPASKIGVDPLFNHFQPLFFERQGR